jgi:hypothetical protein
MTTKTNTELSDWFGNLKNAEKIKVIRDGYNYHNVSNLMENMVKIIEERQEKQEQQERHERQEQEVEDVCPEDEIDEESIIANYTRLGHDNGAYYISTEGCDGIIYRNKEHGECNIRDQVNIGSQFSCKVSFFIDINKTNKLEYKTIRGNNIIYVEISSIVMLRPIVKMIYLNMKNLVKF